MQKKNIHKKVLVAPLDWGLGHATRCVTLIRQLIETGFAVTVASSGNQLQLLENEFPGIAVIPLEGYNIRYSRGKRLFQLKILLQTPKILLSIYREHKWLKKTLRQSDFDIVISDNRYGLYTNKTYCVFMTHQLMVKATYPWQEEILRKINYRFINRYRECWIPDYEGQPNMAGALSHPSQMPKTAVRYIGNLSRFHVPDAPTTTHYRYVILLSGPEPQRTLFEEKVLSVVPALNGRVLLLRGKPGETVVPVAAGNCNIINHVTTKELQQILFDAEYIISRCGYTTVMEILGMRKKSILVPTPGQTEQEYLAGHLMRQRWCYTCRQEEDLLTHIAKAAEFPFQLPSFTNNFLETAVRKLL